MGNMMTMPLTITSIMRHAQQVFGHVELVSVNLDLSRHRYNYSACFQRAAQLAGALSQAGMKQGDCVATLAWNDHYHLEAYYAISCSGAICHTINPRLHPEQIKCIIRSANDRFLLISADLYATLGRELGKSIPFEKIIVYQSDNTVDGDNSVDYDSFIQGQDIYFPWPNLDENQASGLCYTSGTTGNPKGALYSHRSTVLHSYGMALPDSLNMSLSTKVMPVVPMFHVNAWGIPYSAPMVGSPLVLPGRYMGDGKVLAALIQEEEVTSAAGVPTAWVNLLDQMKNQEDGIKKLRSLKMVAIGGASAPATLVEKIEALGPKVRTAWGMTETSPLGCVNALAHSDTNQVSINDRLKAGRPVYGIEFRIVNDREEELPWNGDASGHLEVRGNWVCRQYYHQEADNWDHHGWFNTGDIAKIDTESRIIITDRSKDLIKSGGEWISSIDLENIAASHPDVREAAVIAMPDPKWDERPLLVVTPNTDKDINPAELLEFYQGKVANWWIPDRVVQVTDLPHTATGKVDKKVLRAQFEET